MSTTSPQSDPLSRLERFLTQDPANQNLLAEAFEAALQIGQINRASVHLQAGLASQLNPLAWRFRHAHWHMARLDWPAAKVALAELKKAPDRPIQLQESMRHDMALIALHTGQIEEGLKELAPLVEANSPAPDPAIQTLYLRLLHHSSSLAEALELAQRWERSGGLAPEAAGVASMIALDAEQPAVCQPWAAYALNHKPTQLEARISIASLALAGQAAEQARAMLEPMLVTHEQDGRLWSTWALTQMLAGDLQNARRSFEHALRNMPGHIGTWHGLGWTAFLAGDLDGARAAFERSLAIDHNFGESHGGLAVVLAQLGDRKTAEREIEIALRLDREGMSAHFAQTILGGRATDPRAVTQLAMQLTSRRRRR